MLHYDFASSIWDPYHQNQINRLKMIQHRAAHYVLNQPWEETLGSVLIHYCHHLSGQFYSFVESTDVILLYKN